MNWDTIDDTNNGMNNNTRMLKPMRTRYVMSKANNNTGQAYNPPPTEYSFYQLCSYPEDVFFYVRNKFSWNIINFVSLIQRNYSHMTLFK